MIVKRILKLTKMEMATGKSLLQQPKRLVRNTAKRIIYVLLLNLMPRIKHVSTG
jgi:hypothetical protein